MDDRAHDTVEVVYRFVLSRRWLGFALFVIVLAGVCVRLGFWQLHRLEHRLDNNKIVTTNMKAAPTSITAIEATPDSERSDAEWRRVRLTGTYDTTDQIVVKYQTRDAGPGADIVTPLVTADGTAVLVDRGWMKTQNTGAVPDDIPAPPGGTVAVTGWWRPDSTADGDAVKPDDGQVRAISSTAIGKELDRDLAPGYVNLLRQHPAAAKSLEAQPKPELGQGPHFFYAMQWFFFAGLAVFGWFYFAYAEAHPERRRRRSDAPDGSPVDREHDPGDVRSGG